MKMLILLLLSSLSLNIYFYKNLPTKTYTKRKKTLDYLKTQQSGLRKKNQDHKRKASIFQVNPAELSEDIKQLKNEQMLNDLEEELIDESEDAEKKSVQMNEKFDQEIQKFLEEELSLNNEELQKYNDLRNLKKEKFNSFWDEVDNESEKSDHQVYFPTSQEQIKMAKIEENHVESMKELLGTDGYDRYEKYIQSYLQNLIYNNKDAVLPSL